MQSSDSKDQKNNDQKDKDSKLATLLQKTWRQAIQELKANAPSPDHKEQADWFMEDAYQFPILHKYMDLPIAQTPMATRSKIIRDIHYPKRTDRDEAIISAREAAEEKTKEIVKESRKALPTEVNARLEAEDKAREQAEEDKERMNELKYAEIRDYYADGFAQVENAYYSQHDLYLKMDSFLIAGDGPSMAKLLAEDESGQIKKYLATNYLNQFHHVGSWRVNDNGVIHFSSKQPIPINTIQNLDERFFDPKTIEMIKDESVIVVRDQKLTRKKIYELDPKKTVEFTNTLAYQYVDKMMSNAANRLAIDYRKLPKIPETSAEIKEWDPHRMADWTRVVMTVRDDAKLSDKDSRSFGNLLTDLVQFTRPEQIDNFPYFALAMAGQNYNAVLTKAFAFLKRAEHMEAVAQSQAGDSPQTIPSHPLLRTNLRFRYNENVSNEALEGMAFDFTVDRNLHMTKMLSENRHPSWQPLADFFQNQRNTIQPSDMKKGSFMLELIKLKLLWETEQAKEPRKDHFDKMVKLISIELDKPLQETRKAGLNELLRTLAPQVYAEHEAKEAAMRAQVAATQKSPPVQETKRDSTTLVAKILSQNPVPPAPVVQVNKQQEVKKEIKQEPTPVMQKAPVQSPAIQNDSYNKAREIYAETKKIRFGFIETDPMIKRALFCAAAGVLATKSVPCDDYLTTHASSPIKENRELANNLLAVIKSVKGEKETFEKPFDKLQEFAGKDGKLEYEWKRAMGHRDFKLMALHENFDEVFKLDKAQAAQEIQPKESHKPSTPRKF